ncbi:hypothetical protein [Campylobacter suis]|uniref:Protein ADP-ribosyltransferase n=1 Tax=Campylobacter suis TaxID=2790657 RepID=A0ABM8Q0G4_9BACT|nr:hypothetical protein [Campylobacter suis]CAD7286301.1 Protein ADP-ribosyltransferase [Campylobacter suis]
MGYENLALKFKKAKAVIVVVSNGFSITEGLNIFASDEKFERYFGEFRQKFGVRNVLECFSCNYPDKASKWEFYATFARHYILSYKISQAMSDLRELLSIKPYFIVTSNIEGHFGLAGFKNVFEVEGNAINFQCENACCDEIKDGLDVLKNMANEPKNAINFLPKCQKCGLDMDAHNIFAKRFIGAKNGERFNAFLEQNFNENVLFLELGVGARNQLIKAPLMRVSSQMPNATYVSVNLSEPYAPNGMEFHAKIDEFLLNLKTSLKF